jgi:hypothetical protein
MEISNQRLWNQHLTRPDFATPESVVDWLGAVQAQDYPGGLWTVGLRMAGKVSASDVEQMISSRKVVRSWPLRGTLHFVPAADLRWMLAHLGERVLRRMNSVYSKAGLDEKIYAKCTDLAAAALAGGKSLTRSEIYQVFENAGVTTKNRGLFILTYLSIKGLLCFGEMRGKQHTFVLLDEWVKASRELERDEALGQLALSYFRSHGPAQIKDICWWASLNQADAKVGIEVAKAKLESFTFSGVEYWQAADSSLAQAKTSARRIFLLPPYDEYGIAYKERSAMLKEVEATILYAENGFWSTMIRDGQVVGMWRRVIGKKEIAISLMPAVKISAADLREFKLAAAEYADFFGLSAKVEVLNIQHNAHRAVI